MYIQMVKYVVARKWWKCHTIIYELISMKESKYANFRQWKKKHIINKNNNSYSLNEYTNHINGGRMISVHALK